MADTNIGTNRSSGSSSASSRSSFPQQSERNLYYDYADRYMPDPHSDNSRSIAKFFKGIGDKVGEFWNHLTGKTDRDFAREQAETAYQNQLRLAENEYAVKVAGMRKAGLSVGLMNGAAGSLSSSQVPSVNRVSPGLGDLGTFTSGIFSNILAAKKLGSEIDVNEANAGNLRSNTEVNKATVSMVESVTGLNQAKAKEVAQNIVESGSRIYKMMAEADNLDSLTNLNYQKRETEKYKTRNEEAHGRLIEEDIKKRSAETSQVVYFNEVLLPQQCEFVAKKMNLTDKRAENVQYQTERLMQELQKEAPNVAYVTMHMQDIINTLGEENSKRYFEALQAHLQAEIDSDKLKHHPHFNHGKPGSAADATASTYEWITSYIYDIFYDVSSAIGAGLLKGFRK